MSDAPATAAAPELSPAVAPQAARHPGRAAAWLGLLSAVTLGIVGLSPFWAPSVMPLLPWGVAPVAAPDGTATAVAERIERLDAARNQDRQDAAATTTSLRQGERRLAALEAVPQPKSGDLATAADVAELRQRIAKLATTASDQAARIEAADKAAQAQPAGDPTDTALLLVLLQIREAAAVARPFAAEYDAFAALARNRGDIAAVAMPLADAAKAGLPSRSALAQRLAELAGRIAGAESSPVEDDWRSQTVARLRSLVTIRRIGGAAQTPPERAVSDAQRMLAQGDLAGSVAILANLTGAAAEAAQPWLKMARARLAAEAALRQIEALLVARLAAAAARP